MSPTSKSRSSTETERLKKRIAELEAALEEGVSPSRQGQGGPSAPAESETSSIYRSLSEHLPGIVYRLYLREQNRMEFFNDMYAQITGYGMEEIRKSRFLSIDSLILAEDLERVEAAVHDAMAENRPYQVEYRIKHRNGSFRHLEERGRPILGEDGKPLCVDGVIFDVTEKKTLEQIWKRYEFIVNTSREFMTLIGRGYVYEAVNEAYCQAHKKSREQIIGHTVTEIWGPEAFSRLKSYFDQCFEGKEVNYRFSFQFAALGMRYFDVTYYPYFGSENRVTHVVVVSRDMTKNHQMEVERNRLSIAIQQSVEGVLITDAEGIIEYANPAFEKISGYRSTDLLGKSPRLVKSSKHPALFYRELWQTIKNGDVWKGHFINARRDGSLYETNTTISPVRDEAGQTIHFVAVMSDVTRELIMERQIQQSQKLEAIGTLAGGIAHDFNNILGAILGFADLTRVEIAPDHPVQDNLSEIIQASRRAQDLISQILTFSRHVEPARRPIALQEVVQEGVNLLRATIPKTVQMQTTFPSSPTTILGDPSQIHQVIINLATNAIHSLPGQHGTLAISITGHEVVAGSGPDPIGLTQGKYVVLQIQDSGTGMDQHVLSRMFEPYFTTKPQGKGTGLGLAIVHGIMKEHDGHISVTSEPGKGTTFRLFFPASDKAPQKIQQKDVKAVSGRGRILLIDDEPSLLSFGRKALQNLGYQVETMGDPKAALKLFLEHPDHFDVIITDIAMPNLSGPDLTKAVRAVNQDIPIFLTSGYGSGHISPETAESLKIAKILKKPYSISDLNQALRSVLVLSAKKN